MKLKFIALLFATLVVFSALTATAQPFQPAPDKVTAAARYGELPLSFVPMAGEDRYVAHSGGYSVMIGAREAYVTVRDENSGQLRAVRFGFEQASGGGHLEALEAQQGVTNYYRGDDPANWRLGVKNYARLRARAVYPGVDVVYYGDHRRLEFDFVVAPQADPSVIGLTVSGSEKLYKDAEGNLVAELAGHPVRIARPVAYQRKDGVNAPVQADFVLADGRARLQLGEYDHARELIIDPVVSYATYLGGSAGDTGAGIAVDSAGSIYVTGQTCSSTFPNGPTVSPNPSGYTLQGDCDAYVTKFNAAGTGYVYTTILGGTTPAGASANSFGIALDSSKQAYIVGTTNITNLPGLTGGYRSSYQGGDSDAFIVILKADGTMLRSTYLGGGSADNGYGIALDQSSNVVVVGQTCSDNFPAYASVRTKIEACVAFITKLDNALDIGHPDATFAAPSALTGPATAVGKTYYFSAFFGGAPVAPYITGTWAAGTTYAPGAIIYDSTSPTPNIEIAWGGGTSGSTEPATWSTTLLGYTADGTITWQNLGPAAVPPTAFTEAYGVAIDPPGDIFVAGGTNSGSLSSSIWPCSPNTGIGSWIVKLSGKNGNCIYAWTLETTKTDLTGTIDTARAVAVDSEGRAYVTGTATGNILTTSNAYQSSVIGAQDAYLVRMNIAGSGVEYGTYLGGTGNDQGLGVAVDKSFGAYVVGSTQSQNFPTINPISNPNTDIDLPLGGTKGGFITKFTSDGAGLVFSTYIGGSNADQLNGIAVDSSQNMYVVGTSTSTDLETTLLTNTVNSSTGVVTFSPYVPPQTSYAGNGDAFIAMIPGSGLPTTTVTPGSLVFADQGVGTTSTAQAVQFSINGTSTVHITSIAFSNPEFQQVYMNNPSATTNGADCLLGAIGISSSTASTGCQIWVTFTPTAQTQQFGTLSIQDDTSSTAHVVNLSGQGAVPTVSFSPSSLSFSTQAVNVASSPSTITLTNTSASSSAVLLISSIALSGTNASDFTESDNCQAQVAGGATCIISVTFTPSGTGPRTAKLVITDNTTGSPHSLTLTGTGTLVSTTVSPSTFTFPAQATNVLSSPQVFTVTNTDASQTLSVSSVAITGDFQITGNTCGTVAPGGTCAITVQFDPTTAGTLTGNLTISGNGKIGTANWPAVVSLSGTAGAIAGLAVVNPSLTANVGGSGTQSWTLSNSSPFPLNVYSIYINGAAASLFTQTNNCGTSLLAGSVANPTSCTITVLFTPTAAGNFNASLYVNSDASSLTVTPSSGSTAKSAALLGVATAPVAVLSSTSLNFSNQPLNTSSGALANPIVLSNTGNGPLNISSIAFTGAGAAEFSQTNNCGTQLAAPVAPATSSCTIYVVFTPTAANTQAASMVITDNSNPTTQAIALSGNGYQLTTPTFNPTAAVGLTWSNEPISTTVNDAQTITVTNTDPGFPLTLATPVTTGDFSVSASATTCGTTLPSAASAPANSCVIAVNFAPTATGSRAGTLSLTTSASTTAVSFPLSGIGGASASESPTSLNLGNQNTGTLGTAQAVTLTNSSSFPVNLTSVALSGTSSAMFVATNNCGTTVPASSSCTVSVAFKPTATGVQTATLTISSDAATAFPTVSLSGNGTTPTVSLSPTSLTFGTQALNVDSAAQPVTLTNTGTGVLDISSIKFLTTNPGDFSQTNNCGTQVAAAGGSCTINVVFTPAASGSRSSVMYIYDDASNTPQTVAVSGTGQNSGVISLSTTAMAFSSSSLTQTLTITNSATTGTLTLNNFPITGTGASNFSESASSTCVSGLVLSAGGSCNLVIVYTAGSSAVTATLTVNGSATNSPQSVALSGGPSDFTLTPNYSSVSVVYGNTASFGISVAPVNGYSGSVAFTCTANNGATCTVSPTSTTMDGSTVKSVAVSVGTGSLKLASARRLGRPIFFALMPFSMFGLVLLRRRRALWIALVVAAICLCMGLVACGSGGGSASTSQFPMTVSVSLTGTSGTTSTAHSLSLSVIVTAK